MQPEHQEETKKETSYFVDKLLIASGAIILLSEPFTQGLLPLPTIVVIITVVLLITFAAMTNPRIRWVNKANILISILLLVVFEYLATLSFAASDFLIFGIQQLLALIFLLTLYFSVKTFRMINAKALEDPTIDTGDEPQTKTNEELIAEIKQKQGIE